MLIFQRIKEVLFISSQTIRSREPGIIEMMKDYELLWPKTKWSLIQLGIVLKLLRSTFKLRKKKHKKIQLKLIKRNQYPRPPRKDFKRIMIGMRFDLWNSTVRRVRAKLFTTNEICWVYFFKGCKKKIIKISPRFFLWRIK